MSEELKKEISYQLRQFGDKGAKMRLLVDRIMTALKIPESLIKSEVIKMIDDESIKYTSNRYLILEEENVQDEN